MNGHYSGRIRISTANVVGIRTICKSEPEAVNAHHRLRGPHASHKTVDLSFTRCTMKVVEIHMPYTQLMLKQTRSIITNGSIVDFLTMLFVPFSLFFGITEHLPGTPISRGRSGV